MSVAAVAKKLGGKRVFKHKMTSETDLIQAIRAGLPVQALDSVCEEFRTVTGIQTEIYELVGSARTLQRKRSQHTALSVGESDRLARLARLLVRAEEALGDPVKSRRWLSQPNRALGGQRPLSLLDSDTGALSVERILGRIEHGVYS